MRFWDSSAIIPLIVEEEQSARVAEYLRRDGELWVWWGTLLECQTAVARRVREGALDLPQRAQALGMLLEYAQNWHEIQPTAAVRETAVRLVNVHPLRAADSLQLAAALIASGGKPHLDEFVCLDERLTYAAVLEGYQVLT